MTAQSPPEFNGIPPFFAPFERAIPPVRAQSYVGLTYSVEPGWRHLQLDVHVPTDRSGPVPLVVWIHGGAWLFGVRDLLPPEWPPGVIIQSAIDAGMAVATIDYRHSREAAFPAQLHDAKAAIRYLRAFGPELGIDPDRIAVWGESAGAHLAALVALIDAPELEGSSGLTGPSSTVSPAVLFYPVTDVDTLPPFAASMPPEALAGMAAAGIEPPPEPVDVLLEHSPFPRAEARRILSPISHVRADAPPFLVIHGDSDKLVPPSQGESFVLALQAAGADAEFVSVPGADHVFAGTDPLPQVERAIAFLVEKLKP